MAQPLMIGRAVQRYRGSAPVLWTPLNLGSALVAWWDPNSGVIVDASGNVASWTDRVGGIVASQSNASSRPGFSATARNGKPGLLFNGSQYLTTPAVALPSLDFNMAVAFYGTATGNQIYIVGWGGGGQRQGRAFCKLADNNFYFDETNDGFGDTAPALSNDNFGVVDYLSSSNAAKYFQDGVLVASGSSTLAASGKNAFGIGYWPVYGPSWTGAIQHILICNKSLTTSQRQKLGGWESWADGKAGSNLSSSDPYKSRAPYVSDP